MVNLSFARPKWSASAYAETRKSPRPPWLDGEGGEGTVRKPEPESVTQKLDHGTVANERRAGWILSVPNCVSNNLRKNYVARSPRPSPNPNESE